MAVYDQWHLARPPKDAEACKCGTARSPLYPSKEHKRGVRWQVRWRDLSGKQQKRDFDLKVGKNPDVHADAFDAKIQASLDNRTYTDPALAEGTFQAYAEQWRRSRGHDVERAAWVERMLRNHAYPDPDDTDRTPMGGVPIGQHAMGLLASRPSLTQGWIQAMPLEDGSKVGVVGIASAVYQSAIEDGIIGKDPTRSKSVQRPSPPPTRARPWTPAKVAAMRDALPPWCEVIPELGAGTGMRQGEMFGLAVDDLQFLGKRPKIDISRQVKIIGGKPRFGPIKNRKVHSVPLSPLLAERLAGHLARYPAKEVELPWHEPGNKQLHGTMVKVRLVLSRPRGGAIERRDFDEQVWRPALTRAGIIPPREKGKPRPSARLDGCHALRHTAASVWLRDRIDIVRVAAWLGDTVAMVAKTYAHLLPDDDDEDGRTATDAFLASCAPDVPRGDDVPMPAKVGTLYRHPHLKSYAPPCPCRPGAPFFGLAVWAWVT